MDFPRLSLAPTFMRELFSTRTLPREPEPDAIMTDAEQVSAFTETGLNDSTLGASYLFHTARASQVLQGCRKVLDLGCGPATQLVQIAALNPEIEFTGIDMSEEMLKHARSHVARMGAGNVRFQVGDITRLDDYADQSVDGVISTVSLHHLPSLAHLEQCFTEIGRVLSPGGALYLADFTRLKSLKSVIFFAYMNRDRDPHQLLLDYERSLRAAFLLEEFQSLARERLPSGVEVRSTFKVPLLMTVKTADRPLPEEKIHSLRAMRARIQPRFRRDLDDMRIFFKLGGLGNDVFR
jgi:ubiquinone/menaquinone biosynthesis C-methylase UbiE